MHLTLLFCGMFLCGLSLTSRIYVGDFKHNICVVYDNHASFGSSEESYKYLKRVLGLEKRCTHIYGNLLIDGLHRFDNGTDPDLSFLESIVEISGYLTITNNTVSKIPLTNLRIIRGISKTISNYALAIYHNWQSNNSYLKEIDFRNLRVVMGKNILLTNNPGLVYLQNNVDWSQIIEDPTKQFIAISNKDVPFMSNQTNECHEDCNSWNSSESDTKKFCFGRKKEECQPRTKCTSNKGVKWCNFTKSGETPCNEDCSGGCDGINSENCAVCRSFSKNAKCVKTCAPEHSPVLGEDYTKNSNDAHIYTTGSICTKKCPESLLDQNKHCLFECNFEKYYKSGSRCLECPNDDCTKPIGDHLVCDLAKIDPFNYPKDEKAYTLTTKVLEKLSNCTMIIGSITIDDDSFLYEKITIPMLYKNLNNVKEIYGQLNINGEYTNLQNLTFLSNLREIRRSVTRNAMSQTFVVHVPSLKFLGLKNLQKIYGTVVILGSSNLCYLDTIPWSNVSDYYRSINKNNKTCDPLCTNGCWGPGNGFCYNCQFQKAGDLCVKQCSDAAGFYLPSESLNNVTSYNKDNCARCHPLCKLNCTGPSPKDCNKQCRFVMENETCVKKCSVGHYAVNGICQRCHESCYFGKELIGKGYACSGPSDILGFGGCTMCEKIKKYKNGTRCHKGFCGIDYFKTTIPDKNLDSLIVRQISCEPCHELCTNCTDLGTHMSTCNLCKGYIHNNICVSVCPQEVLQQNTKIDIGQHCPRCDSQCKNGCLLANDKTTCQQCVNKKLITNYEDNKFTCLSSCPVDRNYTEFRNGDILCLSSYETSGHYQRKIIIIILTSCFVILVFLIIVLFIYLRWKSKETKIKAEIKALYSNYKETNMKNMKEDHLSRPANMKKLHMIPLSDLVFDTSGKPLGSGAFGKVFRGYWKVNRQDNKIFHLDVVIKVIHNSSKASTDEFLEEAKIMASVSHRHCLPLIGVCLSLDKPCLISTYAEHGSLEKYLHQNGSKITSYSMLRWAEQIADGMAYLNLRGIIHRDLAARNVLVNSKNIIQITDFGLARLVNESEESIVIKSGKVPIRWLALETLLYASYSSASDVWAYGVTLWEIFTYGKRPYENIESNDIKTYLQQGNRLCQPEISTLDVYMVMIKCWLDDPHMRPSFTELISIFEQFSLTPRRFLYLPNEHINDKSSRNRNPKELISMHQISLDSDCRQSILTHNSINTNTNTNNNNRIEDNSWATTLHNNESAYHLISNNYIKDNNNEDKSFLPSRKKTKRNISFDKIRSFSKFDLSKMLSNKLNKDSKSFTYHSPSIYDGNKTTCTSFDSITPFISQRSSDYDSQPVNPQMVKIKKELRSNSQSSDGKWKVDNCQNVPERIFVDKEATENLTGITTPHITPKLTNRSPKVPPIDIPHLYPKPSPTVLPTRISSQNSPDSGNSHNYDIDDYLIPSHISSAGYYNITPSPSSSQKKQSLNLGDSTLLINNNDYIDDGYLEPIKNNR